MKLPIVAGDAPATPPDAPPRAVRHALPAPEYSPFKAIHHPERLAALRKGWRFPPAHVNLDLTSGPCSHRCVYCPDENQLIPTQRGMKRAGDVVVGDVVFGADGRPRTVVRVTPHEEMLPLWEVKALNLPAIRVSGEHPILTRRGFVTPSEIRDDDCIAAPRPQIPGGPRTWDLQATDDHAFLRTPCRELAEMTPDLAWLLGIYAAEGCVSQYTGRRSRGQVQWTFGPAEAAYAKRVVAVLARALDVRAAIVEPAGENVIRVVANNARLGEALIAAVGASGPKMRVPFDLLGLDFLPHFLEGMCDGNGTEAGGKWEIATANEHFANEIAWAMLALGLLPSVLSVLPADSWIGQRQIHATARSWRVALTGDRQQAIRDASRGMRSGAAPAVVGKYVRYRVEGAPGQETYWLPVTRVHSGEAGRTVIGIEVDGDHTYVVGHLATHNCVGTDPRGFGMDTAARHSDKAMDDLVLFPEERLLPMLGELIDVGCDAFEFTGLSSEPTLHPGFLEALAFLRERGKPYGVITNGDRLKRVNGDASSPAGSPRFLIDARMIEALAHAAYCRVSIDSLSEDVDRRIRNPREGVALPLRERLDGLREMANCAEEFRNDEISDCTVGMGVVVQRANIEHRGVGDLIRFAFNAGVQVVRLVWVQGDDKLRRSLLRDEDMAEARRQVAEARAELDGKVAPGFSRPFRIFGPGDYDSTLGAVGAGHPGFDKAYSACRYVRFVCNVTATGDVYGCCQQRDVGRLKYGNLVTQSASEVFYGEERERVLGSIDVNRDPVCAACIWDRQNEAIEYAVGDGKHAGFV